MDTSETYIKMCQQAEEIQALIPFRDRLGERRLSEHFDNSFVEWEGSWFALPYYIPPAIVLFHEDADEGRPLLGDYSEHENASSAIWLPRQDQLQEMIPCTVMGGYNPAYHLACFMADFVELSIMHDYINSFFSMEQLWLAFVMHQYNKTWDSTREEWDKTLREGEPKWM